MSAEGIKLVEFCDRMMGCDRAKKVIATTKPVSPELVCPECGEYPLTLIDKGMGNRLAQCKSCIYEEEF